MCGKAESWYNLQECYALSHQAEAIFERTHALQNYAIPHNVVKRSKCFIDPTTGLILALIFRLVVRLYNIFEVNTLNKRMDAITAAEEKNLATLKKIISATAGIDDVIKIFWLQ